MKREIDRKKEEEDRNKERKLKRVKRKYQLTQRKVPESVGTTLTTVWFSSCEMSRLFLYHLIFVAGGFASTEQVMNASLPFMTVNGLKGPTFTRGTSNNANKRTNKQTIKNQSVNYGLINLSTYNEQ